MNATAAPKLHSSLEWLNADPQTIEAHQGRVLALVFWNAGSTYCHNLVEQMSVLRARYPLQLSVLGVHQPRFDAEVDGRIVLRAANRLEVNFPVANDRGWVTWQHYGIGHWPSVALIDATGRLRAVHSGDDQLGAIDAEVARLIDEVGGNTVPPPEDERMRNGEPRLALSFPS